MQPEREGGTVTLLLWGPFFRFSPLIPLLPQVAPSYDLAPCRSQIQGLRLWHAQLLGCINLGDFLAFPPESSLLIFSTADDLLQRRHVLSVSQRPHFRIVCAGSFLRGIDMVPFVSEVQLKPTQRMPHTWHHRVVPFHPIENVVAGLSGVSSSLKTPSPTSTNACLV